MLFFNTLVVIVLFVAKFPHMHKVSRMKNFDCRAGSGKASDTSGAVMNVSCRPGCLWWEILAYYRLAIHVVWGSVGEWRLSWSFLDYMDASIMSCSKQDPSKTLLFV
ncbi:hypothetical protein NMG60_11026521 [Bertholletia excelsa]